MSARQFAPERLRQLANYAEQSGNKPWLAEVAQALRAYATSLAAAPSGGAPTEDEGAERKHARDESYRAGEDR